MEEKEIVQIQILPHEIEDENLILSKALSKSKAQDYSFFRIRKRSIDARKKTCQT